MADLFGGIRRFFRVEAEPNRGSEHLSLPEDETTRKSTKEAAQAAIKGRFASGSGKETQKQAPIAIPRQDINQDAKTFRKMEVVQEGEQTKPKISNYKYRKVAKHEEPGIIEKATRVITGEASTKIEVEERESESEFIERGALRSQTFKPFSDVSTQAPSFPKTSMVETEYEFEIPDTASVSSSDEELEGVSHSEGSYTVGRANRKNGKDLLKTAEQKPAEGKTYFFGIARIFAAGGHKFMGACRAAGALFAKLIGRTPTQAPTKAPELDTNESKSIRALRSQMTETDMQEIDNAFLFAKRERGETGVEQAFELATTAGDWHCTDIQLEKDYYGFLLENLSLFVGQNSHNTDIRHLDHIVDSLRSDLDPGTISKLSNEFQKIEDKNVQNFALHIIDKELAKTLIAGERSLANPRISSSSHTQETMKAEEEWDVDAQIARLNGKIINVSKPEEASSAKQPTKEEAIDLLTLPAVSRAERLMKVLKNCLRSSGTGALEAAVRRNDPSSTKALLYYDEDIKGVSGYSLKAIEKLLPLAQEDSVTKHLLQTRKNELIVKEKFTSLMEDILEGTSVGYIPQKMMKSIARDKKVSFAYYGPAEAGAVASHNVEKRIQAYQGKPSLKELSKKEPSPEVAKNLMACLAAVNKSEVKGMGERDIQWSDMIAFLVQNHSISKEKAIALTRQVGVNVQPQLAPNVETTLKILQNVPYQDISAWNHTADEELPSAVLSVRLQNREIAKVLTKDFEGKPDLSWPQYLDSMKGVCFVGTDFTLIDETKLGALSTDVSNVMLSRTSKGRGLEVEQGGYLSKASDFVKEVMKDASYERAQLFDKYSSRYEECITREQQKDFLAAMRYIVNPKNAIGDDILRACVEQKNIKALEFFLKHDNTAFSQYAVQNAIAGVSPEDKPIQMLENRLKEAERSSRLIDGLIQNKKPEHMEFFISAVEGKPETVREEVAPKSTKASLRESLGGAKPKPLGAEAPIAGPIGLKGVYENIVEEGSDFVWEGVRDEAIQKVAQKIEDMVKRAPKEPSGALDLEITYHRTLLKCLLDPKHAGKKALEKCDSHRSLFYKLDSDSYNAQMKDLKKSIKAAGTDTALRRMYVNVLEASVITKAEATGKLSNEDRAKSSLHQALSVGNMEDFTLLLSADDHYFQGEFYQDIGALKDVAKEKKNLEALNLLDKREKDILSLIRIQDGFENGNTNPRQLKDALVNLFQGNDSFRDSGLQVALVDGLMKDYGEKVKERSSLRGHYVEAIKGLLQVGQTGTPLEIASRRENKDIRELLWKYDRNQSANEVSNHLSKTLHTSDAEKQQQIVEDVKKMLEPDFDGAKLREFVSTAIHATQKRALMDDNPKKYVASVRTLLSFLGTGSPLANAIKIQDTDSFEFLWSVDTESCLYEVQEKVGKITDQMDLAQIQEKVKEIKILISAAQGGKNALREMIALQTEKDVSKRMNTQSVINFLLKHDPDASKKSVIEEAIVNVGIDDTGKTRKLLMNRLQNIEQVEQITDMCITGTDIGVIESRLDSVLKPKDSGFIDVAEKLLPESLGFFVNNRKLDREDVVAFAHPSFMNVAKKLLDPRGKGENALALSVSRNNLGDVRFLLDCDMDSLELDYIQKGLDVCGEKKLEEGTQKDIQAVLQARKKGLEGQSKISLVAPEDRTRVSTIQAVKQSFGSFFSKLGSMSFSTKAQKQMQAIAELHSEVGRINEQLSEASKNVEDGFFLYHGQAAAAMAINNRTAARTLINQLIAKKEEIESKIAGTTRSTWFPGFTFLKFSFPPLPINIWGNRRINGDGASSSVSGLGSSLWSQKPGSPNAGFTRMGSTGSLNSESDSEIEVNFRDVNTSDIKTNTILELNREKIDENVIDFRSLSSSPTAKADLFSLDHSELISSQKDEMMKIGVEMTDLGKELKKLVLGPDGKRIGSPGQWDVYSDCAKSYAELRELKGTPDEKWNTEKAAGILEKAKKQYALGKKIITPKNDSFF